MQNTTNQPTIKSVGAKYISTKKIINLRQKLAGDTYVKVKDYLDIIHFNAQLLSMFQNNTEIKRSAKAILNACRGLKRLNQTPETQAVTD